MFILMLCSTGISSLRIFFLIFPPLSSFTAEAIVLMAVSVVGSPVIVLWWYGGWGLLGGLALGGYRGAGSPCNGSSILPSSCIWWLTAWFSSSVCTLLVMLTAGVLYPLFPGLPSFLFSEELLALPCSFSLVSYEEWAGPAALPPFLLFPFLINLGVRRATAVGRSSLTPKTNRTHDTRYLSPR